MSEELFKKKYVPWISYREMNENDVYNIISIKKLESLFGIALLFCLNNNNEELNVIVDDEKYNHWNEAQRRQMKKYTVRKRGGELHFKLSKEESDKVEKSKRKKVKPRKELVSSDDDDVE